MFSLFTKTIYDRRGFILGWGLGMAFLGFLMTIFYPTFNQDNTMDQLLESMPPALQGLMGSLADLKEIPTYLGSQLFDIRMPIFLSIMAIILSIGLTVGEEDRGQMRTLAAMPISRSRIVFMKWLATVLICAAMSLAVAAGVLLGLSVISESLDLNILFNLVAIMGLQAVAIMSIIMGFGFAAGKKGITNGFAIVVTIGGFLISTFAVSVDWLEPYKFLSVFSYFDAPSVAKGVIDYSNLGIYVALIIAFMAVGTYLFRRRDLN